jgi:hypothetical protein
MTNISRTTNQFMPNFDPYAGAASAVPYAFGMRPTPFSMEDRYNQMQAEGEQRRMAEMFRMRGYVNSPQDEAQDMSERFYANRFRNYSATGNQMPWYRQSPMIQFPQGGMMQ